MCVMYAGIYHECILTQPLTTGINKKHVLSEKKKWKDRIYVHRINQGSKYTILDYLKLNSIVGLKKKGRKKVIKEIRQGYNINVEYESKRLL